jgi:YD repeat-containing protein
VTIGLTENAPNMPSDAVGNFPVNPESGDFWHSFTDVSVNGYGPGLNLSSTYNSLQAASTGMFGYGWTPSYSNVVINTGASTATVTLPDGSQVVFTLSGGVYTAPTWSDSTFVANTDGTYTFVNQKTETFSYNSGGYLTAITDPNNVSTSLTYNTSNQLTTITDAAGRTITLAYNSNGFVSSATDPMGRVTHYYYTAYGSGYDLTSVSDPLGNVTSFAYYPSTATQPNFMETMTLPNGQSGGPDAGATVSMNYNSNGQVSTQTDQMGNVTTYTYSGTNGSTTGGSTTVTDPNGNATVYNYVSGTLNSKTVGYGTSSAATWSYLYDATTLAISQTTDPNSNVTSSTYDANGNVLTDTNGLGKVTSYSYNSFNEQTCVAQPLASNPCSSLTPPSAITAGTATITPPSTPPPPFVTYSEYDTKGNLIYTTTGDYAPGSSTATQSATTYDLYNGQSVTLGSTTDSCTTTAPSSELPCATINANDVVTQLGYDSYGDVTSKSTANGVASANPGTISTFAGGPMGSVTANQLAQQTGQLAAVTIGGTSYAYVTDESNNVVRRINLSTGAETVVAGNYIWGDFGDGGPATSAQLGSPNGVAVDSSGDIVIGDTGNNVVRFVPASSGTYFGRSMTAGDIYTIAGNGASGYSGNGGVATSAELSNDVSVAMSTNGVAVADQGNNVVRFLPFASGTYFGQAMTAGDIYTIAGNATSGYSGDGSAATSAELNSPGSVAFDGSGNLAVADTNNNVVRFVPVSSGTNFAQSMTANDIYTIAGNATSGYSGNGGAATSAELDSPGGVTFDSTGNLAVADSTNYAVRFVPKSSGTFYGQSMTANDIYTIAGDHLWGNTGNAGAATSATIDDVADVAIDANGNVALSVGYDGVVRIVAAASGTLAGQSVTANDIYGLAGTGADSEGTNSGAPSSVEFNQPSGVRVDAAGDVVIADTGNNTVRFVPATSGTYFGQSMAAHTTYTIAGNGVAYFGGDGGSATSASLNSPNGVAIDTSGDVAVADTSNNEIRFVPATSGTYFGIAMTAGNIYAVAGNNVQGYSGNGGAATSGELSSPISVAFDPAGDLLIADTDNNVVRFVPVASGTYFGQAMTANDIYTIAGNGTAGYTGDGAAATTAEISSPGDATVDGAGNLLIADTNNNVVRFVPAASGTYYGQAMTANDIYTIAGNGTAGYTGGGGAATSAQLNTNYDAVVDA